MSVFGIDYESIGGGLPDLETESFSGTTTQTTTLNTTKKPIGVVVTQWNSAGTYKCDYFIMRDWSKFIQEYQNTFTTPDNAYFTFTDNSVSFVIGASYNYKALVIVE